jgi:hypothetical protein
MCRAASSSLCVHNTIFLYPGWRAKRMHSLTKQKPMPNLRAAGSTYNKRSFAMVLDFAVTKTEPTISPSFSADPAPL